MLPSVPARNQTRRACPTLPCTAHPATHDSLPDLTVEIPTHVIRRMADLTQAVRLHRLDHAGEQVVGFAGGEFESSDTRSPLRLNAR